ncbi:MAG TPA: branched-chain amino acid ABC transporter permease [Candidatus Dormibacteraeota bacterium]|nr:branched-chain amino acid ABC transporter permease [Candidatus Dormibacteraeota bacterium]
MSEVAAAGLETSADVAAAGAGAGRRALAIRVGVVALVALFPLVLGTFDAAGQDFWLQSGDFAFAAMIGALGLTLLVGGAGQLSLAHSFYVAIGAYAYVYLSSPVHGSGTTIASTIQAGAGLPTLLAIAGAALIAGLAGLLFSPISARLRGIYLGVASLGLVFVGQHIAFNAQPLSGGFNGRDVLDLNIFGFNFDSTPLSFLGVTFTRNGKLWYVGLAGVVLAYLYYVNVLRGRPGRALRCLRDSEVAASVLGVNVVRYKAYAFTLSSMYAGLAGAIYALVYHHIVPDTFGLSLTVAFLAMIVIGGLGSPGGALVGALFVSALPAVLAKYSDSLPFIAPTGSGGVTAGVAAQFIYGATVILLLVFEPGGVAALARRIPRLASRIRRSPHPPSQKEAA